MRLRIIKGDFDFPPYDEFPISKEAKKLINDMLDLDPESRIDIEEILISDWMRVLKFFYINIYLFI